MSIETEFKKMIGNRIRDCRKEKKLTQTELGKKIGTIKTTIANYESGYSNPSTTNLYKLAIALDVSIGYLEGSTIHKTSKVYLEEELSKLNLTKNELDKFIDDVLNDKIGLSFNIMKAKDITDREDKMKKLVSELIWEYTYPLVEEEDTVEDIMISKKLKKAYYDLFRSIDKEKILDNYNDKSIDSATNKGIRIPVLGKIPAGVPIELIEEILDYEDIPSEMLKGGKEYFALKVQGNSMEPKYLDNDIIIILKQDNCESGQDCIVTVNGNDGTFKRVFIANNGITLQPLNAEYMPVFYSNDEVISKPVKILGVVKEIRRSV